MWYVPRQSGFFLNMFLRLIIHSLVLQVGFIFLSYCIVLHELSSLVLDPLVSKQVLWQTEEFVSFAFIRVKLLGCKVVHVRRCSFEYGCTILYCPPVLFEFRFFHILTSTLVYCILYIFWGRTVLSTCTNFVICLHIFASFCCGGSGELFPKCCVFLFFYLYC